MVEASWTRLSSTRCMYSDSTVMIIKELLAISASNAKILLCGHYVNIVANTGHREPNPCFRQWEYCSNVPIYGEYVGIPAGFDVD